MDQWPFDAWDFLRSGCNSAFSFRFPCVTYSPMHTAWLRVFLLSALFGASGLAADKKNAARPDDGHAQEELGVNKFTTPGIELVLKSLRELHPVPYEKVSRDIPEQAPSDRAHLALSAGGIIADGFLAVAAEKASRLEPIGRALLKHAKGLGVGDHVTKHAKSIIERAAKKDWNGVRAELSGAQRDVEKGMMALKDEEIAHLVSLGGWWRGLEIASGIVADSYTPERAALLVQPSVLDYFADRVSTLNPRLKKAPVFVVIEKNIRDVRALAAREDRSPPGVEDVKKIHAIARATNDAISKPEE
jgi:hypothetical protein